MGRHAESPARHPGHIRSRDVGKYPYGVVAAHRRGDRGSPFAMYGRATEMYGRATEMYGRATEMYGRATEMYGRAAARPYAPIASCRIDAPAIPRRAVAGFKSASTRRINEWRRTPGEKVWASQLLGTRHPRRRGTLAYPGIHPQQSRPLAPGQIEPIGPVGATGGRPSQCTGEPLKCTGERPLAPTVAPGYAVGATGGRPSQCTGERPLAPTGGRSPLGAVVRTMRLAGVHKCKKGKQP
jgi:hypothetical protein